MSDAKAKEYNPLAVNILRLQNYSNYFDLSELVFFEWLMIKASSFKNQYEFYYSVRRIAEETKIKKAQLATIIQKFEAIGIITVEKKGMPKCSYFHVNKETVIALIPEIYQFSENGKLLPENGKLLSYFGKLLPENGKHKGTYKEPNKELLSNFGNEKNMVVEESTTGLPSSFSENKNPLTVKEIKVKEAADKKAKREAEQKEVDRRYLINKLKNILNRVYEERVQLHNSQLKKGGRARVTTKLSFLKRDEDKLYELGKQYGDNEVEGSFMAFVDAFLKEEIEVAKPVPYFLKRKPETKDFDTFHTYLNHYTTDYTYQV